MRDIVYLDIETVPDTMPNLNDKCFSKDIHPDIIDGEVIAEIVAENWQHLAKTRALSNIDCRIISLSYAINDEPVVNIFEGMHEKDLIRKLLDSDLMYIMGSTNPLVCAYNALQFDLPVIATKLYKYRFKRFVAAIPYLESKYKHDKVFDPMAVFPYTYNERWLTQSRMAEYLDIEDDAEMHGSMVYEAYLDFHYEEIIKYNNQDVELLRKICKKIMI